MDGFQKTLFIWKCYSYVIYLFIFFCVCIPLCMYTTSLYIHLWIYIYITSHVLAVVYSATMNIVVHVSFWSMVFFGDTPGVGLLDYIVAVFSVC